MHKRIMALLFLFLSGASAAESTCRVFTSFSMPESLLLKTLQDSASHDCVAVLRGLHQDSMQETVKKILALTRKYPELSLQIDPEAFVQYAINAVPAVVVDDGKKFDVVYGNIPVEEALAIIRRKGEVFHA